MDVGDGVRCEGFQGRVQTSLGPSTLVFRCSFFNLVFTGRVPVDVVFNNPLGLFSEAFKIEVGDNRHGIVRFSRFFLVPPKVTVQCIYLVVVYRK